MDFKNDKVKCVLWGVAFSLMAIVLVFRIPVFIDLHFRYLKLIDHCNTTYTSSDILQYYGILLGAAAAIVAVLLTINYSRKTSEESRIEFINAEYRKIGIDTCLKLLAIFDIQTFEKYRQMCGTSKYTDQNLLDDLGYTADEMHGLAKDFRRIYRDQRDGFDKYINWYFKQIELFIENNNIELLDKNGNNGLGKPTPVKIKVNNANDELNEALKLRNEHKNEFESVNNFIIDTMTTYEVKKS